jgi:cytochrome P450
MSTAVDHLPSLLTTAEIVPNDWYAQARERDGVWDEGMNAYLFSSYDAVRQITLQDSVLWRNPLVRDDGIPIHPSVVRLWNEWMGSQHRLISLDGEDQKRVHRWWIKAFSMGAVDHWRETAIHPVIDERIDEFIGSGKAELADGYAGYTNPRIILTILGVPLRDDEWINTLYELAGIHDSVFEYTHASPPRDVLERGANATQTIHRMFMAEVLRRREERGDDFISMIWNDAEELFGGQKYTEHDVANQAFQAFISAGDTTSGMACNGLYLLASDGPVQSAVREGGREGTQRFVEEALRLYGSISFRPRIAKQDLSVNGVKIKAGEMVIVIVNAANLDPRHYGCPATVRFDRELPNDHLGFWKGPRQCPGRALARLIMEELYQCILDRTSSLSLDSSAEQPSYTGFFIRKWAPLNVVFEESRTDAEA